MLEGTRIVMSGLVPLSTDLMRYLFPSTRNLSHNIYNAILRDYRGVLSTNKVLRNRSEIALQASSFGAELLTK